MEEPTYSQSYLDQLEKENRSTTNVKMIASFAVGFIVSLIIVFLTTF